MGALNTIRCHPQPRSMRLFGILIVTGLVGACADDKKSESRRAGPSETVQYASPELAVFEMFLGVWTITENHFNAAGDVTATVNGTERITWVLDNRAIQRIYTSGMGSSVYRAMGMLTWNATEKKYSGVWFDNASTTGPVQLKADWADKNLRMTYVLESLAKDGSLLRHRVEERFVDEERRLATTYVLSGTEPLKVLEIEYRRATPCPAGGARRIIDELSQKPGN